MIARLTVMPSNRSEDFPAGTLISDALSDMGFDIAMPCGGKGICGRCIVHAQGSLSPRSDREMLLNLPDNQRLACQARIAGDTTVRIDTQGSIKPLLPAPILTGTSFGVAVDIGTTTIQISLVEIPGGAAHIIASFYNPQRRFGHDVISRIAASGSPEAFSKQVSLLRSSITGAVARAIGGLPSKQPPAALAFSGNTVMTSFLFGIPVAPIGVFPYRPQTIDFSGLTPSDLGLNASADVRAFPSVSAFLGGDFLGGVSLLLEQGFTRNCFFIDIGTNGEMCVIDPAGRIFATSCAMGPALEGMNISRGMTASQGAITHCRMEHGHLVYDVMGDTEPRGISGTGLIDLLSILISEGIVARDGRIVKNEGFEQGGLRVATADGKKSAFVANDIFISQQDIRSVQLAKGASFSAAGILLEEAQCRPEDIRQVIIAGAFGENLAIEHFQNLKLLPDFGNAEYRFVGNSSLKAAERACLDPSFIPAASALRKRISVIELSVHPDFNDRFVSALNF